MLNNLDNMSKPARGDAVEKIKFICKCYNGFKGAYKRGEAKELCRLDEFPTTILNILHLAHRRCKYIYKLNKLGETFDRSVARALHEGPDDIERELIAKIDRVTAYLNRDLVRIGAMLGPNKYEHCGKVFLTNIIFPYNRSFIIPVPYPEPN